MTCDIKDQMSESDSGLPFPPPSAFDADSLPGPSSPVARAGSRRVGILPFVEYSPTDATPKFAEQHCPLGRPILLRNVIAHDGQPSEVASVSSFAFRGWQMRGICISSSLVSLGESCLMGCNSLQVVVFEGGSHLREIGRSAFACCDSLRSIAIPFSTGLLGPECFHCSRSLELVTFELPSRLATIGASAFSHCRSLSRLVIPASVTAIADSVFKGSGISSIEIEDGSISFRVENEFLVDFEFRSLVWVIGSPESIEIPSSIEELRPFCCSLNETLMHVEFESDSTVRSIGQCAFAFCAWLESICIPSSVEVVPEGCFEYCQSLETVTFGSESRLRLIERDAFECCGSLGSVSVPASVEVIDEPPVSFVSRQ
jgi:hypothetical protein